MGSSRESSNYLSENELCIIFGDSQGSIWNPFGSIWLLRNLFLSPPSSYSFTLCSIIAKYQKLGVLLKNYFLLF